MSRTRQLLGNEDEKINIASRIGQVIPVDCNPCQPPAYHAKHVFQRALLEANGLIVAGQTAACMRMSHTESNHCPHIGDKPEVVPKRPCRQGWGGSSGWTQGAGADAAYIKVVVGRQSC